MKEESRTAIFSNYDGIFGICVFRGNYLEHIFFGFTEDDVKKKFEESTVFQEVSTIKADQARKTICDLIIRRVGQKINKIKS
ncbi:MULTISPECIES: hypothetical protein [Acidianus]|uniref:Uncharacterized protein n=1 Tax=Candidatus Acidianus copahuensis TaxID=1160895 RepID=A0A031LMT2_9CREN|nr:MULTISPECIES: hypothetical protein [Acidianus]EZQ06948.1 hypothetical protein CM19_06195 [Candidatus Acidianus copahuensis]NON62357.1 hypothetical protein [Acidianus sp. RZ1]